MAPTSWALRAVPNFYLFECRKRHSTILDWTSSCYPSLGTAVGFERARVKELDYGRLKYTLPTCSCNDSVEGRSVPAPPHLASAYPGTVLVFQAEDRTPICQAS